MKRLFLVSTVAGFSLISLRADVTVGWREAQSVHVGADGSETFSGRLTIGDGGEFYKTGSGTLTIPASSIDRQAPYTVKALGGTVAFTSGEAPAAPSAPAVCQKAALWVAADANVDTETEEIPATEPDGEATTETRVTRWRDVRETGTGSRSYPSLKPDWKGTQSAFYGKNPVYTTKWGNKAVYCNGAGSGQFLVVRNAADGAQSFDYATAVFAVIGNFETRGVPFSHTSQNVYNGGMQITDVSGNALTKFGTRSYPYFAWMSRGDQNGGVLTGRNAINGVTIDAFYGDFVPMGYHLYTGVMAERPLMVDSIFARRFVASSAPETSPCGGDYVSEVLIFTNKLTEAEVASVERYLMGRWTLESSPEVATVDLDRDVGHIGTAKGATVSFDVAEGDESAPVSFFGEGEVVKSGEGTLIVGPSGRHDAFGGEFTLVAGKVRARGGAIPTLAVRAGDTLDATIAKESNTPNRDQQLVAGTEISFTAREVSGTVFAKTGAAEARVSKVTGAVSAIDVRDGSLVLAAPYATASLVPSDDNVAVTVPNGDFEGWGKDNPSAENVAVGSFPSYSWYGGKGSFRWSKYTSGGIVNVSYLGVGFAPGEGTTAWHAKQGAWGSVQVNFPKAGQYELSVISNVRKANSETTYNYGVYLGDNANLYHATLVGVVSSGRSTGWVRHHVRFTVTAAGSYYLGFDPLGVTMDDSYFFDDVKVRFVGESAHVPAVTIPNGDFETYDYAADSTLYGTATTAAKAKGWTFDLTDATFKYQHTELVKDNPGVCLVSAGINIAGYKPVYSFKAGDMTWGSTHLAFIGAKGRASTTFSVPAGTYQLQGRLARWTANVYFRGVDAATCGGVPSISAKVTLPDGSTVVDLGEVAVKNHLWGDKAWLNPFTVPEAGEITLTLEQTSAAVSLVDDLRLETPDTVDEGELVLDGSSENFKDSLNSDFWATYYPPEGGMGSQKGRSFDLASEGNQRFYGYTLYSGRRTFQFGQNIGVSQKMRFPAPGVYRVRFAAKSRMDNIANNGCNPVRVELKDSADNIRTLLRTKPFLGNWQEFSALFKVETAGEYTLILRGETADKGDRISQVDGISVRKVSGTLADVPDLPADALPKINVAAGSLLQLDYPGTLPVGRVKLGGKFVKGEISAETHPDFITGMGKLLAAEGPGLFLIVK